MTYRLTILILLLLPAAFAQNLPEETFIDEPEDVERHIGERLARFTYADEHIVVQHDDQFEEPAIRNMPAVAGDIINTPNKAYAEIEFIDGSLLQIADRSQVEFQAINEIYAEESLTIVKLHEGTLFLHVTDDWIGNETRLFRIDTSSGSAYIEYPGIYTVDIEGSMMVLKVFRGFAELSGEEDSAIIQSGEYSTIRHITRPTRVRPFNSFNSDRFERWAYSRRPARDSISSKYVDNSIAAYANDLDDSGDWRYEGDLGRHVWVPYVEVDWRPYTAGYWCRRAGVMTWISYDPFGWVTHHYGRWGWSVSLGWYWIPDRFYSPAWVAWTSYNNYIGWCPLGYWNRPYYYQYDRPNVVIINNHRHHWNYVSSTTIINRGRDYSYRPIATRGSRRVTTRPIYVNSRDFTDARDLTRVIRDPKINRSRSLEVNRERSAMMIDSRSGDSVNRSTIRTRDTGTRATSRHASTATRRRGADASSILDRSRPSTDTTIRQRGGTTEPNARPTTRGTNRSSTRDVPTRKDNQPSSTSATRGNTNRPSTNTSRPTSDPNRPTSTSRPTSGSSRPTTTRPPANRPTVKPKPSDNKDDNRSRLSQSGTSRSSTTIRETYRDRSESNIRTTTRQPANRSRVQSPKQSTRPTVRPRSNSSNSRSQATSRSSSRPRATSRTSTQRSQPRARPKSSNRATATSRPSAPRSQPRAKPRTSSRGSKAKPSTPSRRPATRKPKKRDNE